jgi:uncharacterized protein YeaO (DUF488 family)
MKFFTSYYANIKNIPKDYILVSISGDIPDYIKEQMNIWDRRFAPNWDLFKEYKNSPEGQQRENKYVERFKNEVLTKYDSTDILKDWSDKAGLNEKFVLLCYEVPEDFCHRHIVAEALEEKYGVEIPEIGIDNTIYERKNYKFQPKDTLNEEEW